MPRLKAENVPYAVVNNYAEALSDQQVRHRGLIRELNHPQSGRIRVVGPPMLGEHTGEILREWLDWSEDQISRPQNEREKSQASETETIF